ncbi:NAD(P)/FAD-dependent oxidoreductase [Effusibacillus lacus]|uniref:Pyridine nucleotide-disulfide oxidoreductase n=1 Tax=Effusibacillus lacus TaxID=1348429 RepID=A0A292YQ95_9BACL|nr:NAD(P)/FAD-dependent oxidoreductase [Effusibacillus lacus]TCS68757.1 NADH dehydrogenase [Effusibacillus lacus]GAX90675.1 pyridine nucleotide-disulfide oxidoreductase [Effusibacillus lacus]
MAKVLILGAGYGGMAAAVKMQKARIPFTIINKHSYHYFTTLLHEPAGGRNDFDPYYVEISEVLNSPEATIVKDTIKSLNPSEKKVIGEGGEYSYDYLIFALGNAPEFFGIPGLAEHSLLLRSLETAKEVRSHIDEMFALYAADKDPARLRIVVGGAGLTGVELCGELSEYLPHLAHKYKIPEDKIELINLEAAPTILPMLDERLRETALDVLTRKGVQVRTNEKIVRVGENEVELATGEKIEANTIIWTGGVRANPLLAEAGFDCDPRGRAKVNEFLQSVNYEDIFVIGDSACFIGEDGRPLPPTAQLAGQMGEHVVENLKALMNGQPMKKFSFNYMGTLASIGSEVSVGNVKGFKTKGVTATVLKEASKAKWLMTLGGLSLVARKNKQFTRSH